MLQTILVVQNEHDHAQQQPQKQAPLQPQKTLLRKRETQVTQILVTPQKKAVNQKKVLRKSPLGLNLRKVSWLRRF